MCLGIYDFVRCVQGQMAVSLYQTLEAKDHETLGRMEKVLGAHGGRGKKVEAVSLGKTMEIGIEGKESRGTQPLPDHLTVFLSGMLFGFA